METELRFHKLKYNILLYFLSFIFTFGILNYFIGDRLLLLSEYKNRLILLKYLKNNLYDPSKFSKISVLKPFITFSVNEYNILFNTKNNEWFIITDSNEICATSYVNSYFDKKLYDKIIGLLLIHYMIMENAGYINKY